MIWRILVAVLVASLIVLWTMWTLAVNAHAGVRKICNTFTGECWLEHDGRRAAPRKVHRKRHKHRHRRKRRAEVRGYVQRETDSDGVKCKDTLTVIGDARPSEDGARDDAEKAFMRAARFRHGESWMSIENARDYAVRCSRASITEIVGQVMHRCELKAKPCRPPFQSK
jgi:hypothetical protein